MDASWGVAIQPILSHTLVYSSNSLYLYKDSDLHSTPSQYPFPLYNVSIFTTLRNYLLCRPSFDHIAVYQFDLQTLAPPSLVGIWHLPTGKVSIACWATYDDASSNLTSPTEETSARKPTPYALIGTRDGTILRLDLASPGILTPITMLSQSSSPIPMRFATPPQPPSTPSIPYSFDAAETPIYVPRSSHSHSDSTVSDDDDSSNITQTPTEQSTQSQSLIPTPQGTVSSIAAAPCGKGIYAIGYVTGHISIVQFFSTDSSYYLRPIHQIQPIGSPKKIVALAWHYSSKSTTAQSLAALKDGSDKMYVWTVDVFDSYKKIREVALPSNDSQPSTCANFLQWSKSGKVVRISSSGFLISDVRTKKVTTKTVPMDGEPSIVAILVRSSKGRAFVINGQGNFNTYNLLDGGSEIDTASLPFTLKPIDTGATAILESPVVYLQNVKVGQITQVTITKSPRSTTCDGKLKRSRTQIRTERIIKTHKASASQPPPESTLADISTSYNDSPIRLSMTPIKATTHSLFSSVLKNLSRMPAQRVQEFMPTQLSMQQYILCALFGGVYNTTVCLMGIEELVQHSISSTASSGLSPELRTSVLQLFLKQHSYNSILTIISESFADISKPLIAALLFAQSDSSAKNLENFKSALNLTSDLHEPELQLDQLHFSCAYLYSLGHSFEAQQLYLSANLYIEAVVISLLDPTLPVIPVLRSWHAFLVKCSQQNVKVNTDFVNYLNDIANNLELGLSSLKPKAITTSSHPDKFVFPSAKRIDMTLPERSERSLPLSSSTSGNISSFNITVPARHQLSSPLDPMISSSGISKLPASIPTTATSMSTSGNHSSSYDMSAEDSTTSSDSSSYSSPSSTSSLSMYMSNGSKNSPKTQTQSFSPAAVTLELPHKNPSHHFQKPSAETSIDSKIEVPEPASLFQFDFENTQPSHLQPQHVFRHGTTSSYQTHASVPKPLATPPPQHSYSRSAGSRPDQINTFKIPRSPKSPSLNQALTFSPQLQHSSTFSPVPKCPQTPELNLHSSLMNTLSPHSVHSAPGTCSPSQYGNLKSHYRKASMGSSLGHGRVITER